MKECIKEADRVYYNLKHPAKKRDDNKRIRAAIMAAGCHVYDIAGRLGIGEATLYRWLRWELPEQKFLLIMEAIEYEAASRGKTFPKVIMDIAGIPWEEEEKTAGVGGKADVGPCPVEADCPHKKV